MLAGVQGVVGRLTGLVLAMWLSGALLVGQSSPPRGEVVFPDTTVVSVEVAATPAQREQGLMFRPRLAEHEGMVFVFEQTGFYPFWMKNTLVALDILWLDTGRRVVSISESVPPCKADPCPTFPPTADALYVVEVVSGFSKKHGVRVGDVLTMRNIEPARPATR